MGLYFVNAVLNGLKGRKLSVGKKKLTASDIAMLVTIANQQPNPGSYHGDWNPAATIDPKSMSAYTHLARRRRSRVAEGPEDRQEPAGREDETGAFRSPHWGLDGPENGQNGPLRPFRSPHWGH